MELSNTFSVSQPIDRAWAVITDLERVAPCLPGAALIGVEGEDFRGAVKIKVGPVTAQYEGVARFAQRDDQAHRAVLRAEGRDVRGQGNAATTIDLRLQSRGAGTEVLIDTELELAGRVAQFGRGVIADVSGKLIGQFAQRLEAEMSREQASVPPATNGVAVASPARPAVEDVEPLDLMSAGGSALAAVMVKQAAPVAGAVLGLLLGWLLGRRSGSGTRDAAAAPLVVHLVLPSRSRTTAPGIDVTRGSNG
ncbi:SRPBCC family protein [Pseudonocardia kunmingensis]|uniref:Carbon monoxide dehydrogenase subunit G n=1 Tax=Pseudonocardia kunmingensis TaxID=630975 RepID=A0A543DPK2_9PSEU|nr:SRPBCC family protein [Pseudonocardia kunmingensis]TQM11272.1 hypothetical protein FB558_3830 [Pseudonocardia kunmingensis]